MLTATNVPIGITLILLQLSLVSTFDWAMADLTPAQRLAIAAGAFVAAAGVAWIVNCVIRPDADPHRMRVLWLGVIFMAQVFVEKANRYIEADETDLAARAGADWVAFLGALVLTGIFLATRHHAVRMYVEYKVDCAVPELAYSPRPSYEERARHPPPYAPSHARAQPDGIPMFMVGQ